MDARSREGRSRLSRVPCFDSELLRDPPMGASSAPMESEDCSHRSHQVVIIGGGFGGLSAVLCLKNAPVGVTLIDRRNFHLFQPLLYQVATGGLSPANIAAPLRAILKNQRNTRRGEIWRNGFRSPRFRGASALRSGA